MGPLKSFFKTLFKRWQDKPKDQSFYVKMFFALISSIVCGLYGTAFAGIRGVMFGFLVYVLSLYVIVYLLEIDPADLGGRTNLIKDGIFSYLLLWLLLWTLIYGFVAPLSIYTPLPL
ncbi:MAG: hypothetical protein K9W43_00500 [Candidatus Thorarchaeota archaeon]|nr:hypothetical protein [Candidatus Thorarchaeota archaeon]